MNNCIYDSFNDFDIAQPKPDAMIQSLRAFGYDLSTAIADLIDNSIAAEAKNIWLDFHWDGENSWIAIKDDGKGMTEEELVKAMVLGSTSPLLPRSSKDLGRFGLGLKTASFSQGKSLTVATKIKDGKVSIRCWDLDYVTYKEEWRLLKPNTFNNYLSELNHLNHGTIVLLEKLDRLVYKTHVDNQKNHSDFLDKVTHVKKHVSMVFHRFLEPPNSLKIWINDREVKPWNPFLLNEKSTELITIERLYVNGKRIEVKPYILPHHSNLSPDTYNEAAGLKGWSEQQGFYVYRNKRMLVSGDWLGLGLQKEEQYKLARILIDIPNDMDDEWEIDVKKSRAKPPRQIRDNLKRIAKLTRERSSNIYRHRGKIISRNSTEFVYLWQQSLKHGKISYKINREHPIIKYYLNQQVEPFETLLKLLEETIPIPMILMSHSQQPEMQSDPFENYPPSELTHVLQESIKSLKKQGLSLNEAKSMLLLMEPFNLYPEYIESYYHEVEE